LATFFLLWPLCHSSQEVNKSLYPHNFVEL
jgi:hypothetical protein